MTQRGALRLERVRGGVRAAEAAVQAHLVREMWARCGRDVGEMWARCGRDVGRHGETRPASAPARPAKMPSPSPVILESPHTF